MSYSHSIRLMTGLAVVALVGGCVAQGPAYPLMTPIQVTQSFGYDQHALDGNRFEVSYVTPTSQSYGYRFDQSPAEHQAKDMAFDLATLHAAELAKQAGWAGFSIVDRQSSSDQEYASGAWDYPYGPYWHRRGWGGWGGGWGPGWRGDFYEPPRNDLQAEVKLTIEFVQDVKPGQYRAADVIQQVLSRYPTAESATPMPAAQPTAMPPAAAPPPPKTSAI